MLRSAISIKDALQGFKVEITTFAQMITDSYPESNASDTICKLLGDVAALIGRWSYNGRHCECGKGCRQSWPNQERCFDEERDAGGAKAGQSRRPVVQQPYEFGYQRSVNGKIWR